MKHAYLETNAISCAADESISGKGLRDMVRSRGFTPVVGFHTIYELAKTFVNINNNEIAKTLFQIVRDLEAEYSEESRAILWQEYQHCFEHKAITPFLDGCKRADTLTEVCKLARGLFDVRARSFIEDREKRFRAVHPVISKSNIQIFREKPATRRLRTFEDVISYYKDDTPSLIVEILDGKPTIQDAQSVFKSIEDYPALKAAVMANMYLFYVQMVHKVVPATDKIDDHRHVVEASYCDAFITQDRQLLKNVAKINPCLEPVSWRTLK